MGNYLSAGDAHIVHTCHHCKMICRVSAERQTAKHGADWVEICSQKCLTEWKQYHDHNGYCCKPDGALYRPLLSKK